MSDNDFKLIKTEEKISSINKDIENYDVYIFKFNDNVLGYGLIKKEKNDINNIYLYILEEHRGYGYGNMLFKKLLEVLKNANFEEIMIDIDITNYRMINIVNKNNSIELTNINGIKRFLLNFK